MDRCLILLIAEEGFLDAVATLIALEEQLPLSCSHSNGAALLDHMGSLRTVRKIVMSGTD